MVIARMWEHYCEVEKDIMGIEENEPCNWCGDEEEKHPIYQGKFWIYPAQKFVSWEESLEYYRELDKKSS